MHDFADKNQEDFNKIIMESSCRSDGCPFALMSIGLVQVLCDVFNVDAKLYEVGLRPPVYKFVLTETETFKEDRKTNFLKEIFTASIHHVFKTWRDMRALPSNKNDVSRVIDVTQGTIHKPRGQKWTKFRPKIDLKST